MCIPVKQGDRKLSVAIVTLAAVFTIIYVNSAYAFRSEEESIDETRQAVEKHLNDGKEARFENSVPIDRAPQQEPQKAEEKQPAPAAKEIPVNTEEKKAEAPAAEEAVETQPATSQDQQPEAPQDQSQAAVSTDQPQNTESVDQTQPAAPPDVQPVGMVEDYEGTMQPVGQGIDLSAKDKKVMFTEAIEQPVLKKMDINRIGAAPYYETYEGLRLLKYFTVGQRVEIYGEPRPIDSYILDANAMRYLYHNTPWNQKADYRTQLVPVFTRAYGTEITFSDPKNKEGQIRYTHDYRNIYRNYFPKYDYNDLHGNESGIKEEMWDQNEVLLMHTKFIEPINWLYTSNLGYRYSTMNCKSDPVQTAPYYSYYEVRQTYFGSMSLAPTDKVEYFFQGEYYKSEHVKSSWSYRPDHFMGRTEIRIKSKDLKTTFVPSLSFSKDLYYPTANTYEKYEIAFRVGRDWTKRFSTTHTLQYVYSYRDEPDNQAPLYTAGYYNPHKDKAEYIAFENRFAYNVYDRLYLQAGADLNSGINWSIFDNFALLGGLEYYAPGIIRIDVGWRGNYYYDLNDFMSSIYFKFYLFM